MYPDEEKLKIEQDLLILFGWERDTEYDLGGFGKRYRIKDGCMQKKDDTGKWREASVELTPGSIKKFRRARKVSVQMPIDELVSRVQNLINRAHLKGIGEEYYEDLFDAMEDLRSTSKKELTSNWTEILGWDEGAMYVVNGKTLTIFDNGLWEVKNAQDSFHAPVMRAEHLLDTRQITKYLDAKRAPKKPAAKDLWQQNI